MGTNATLNNAKYSANTDEWYTTYETISEELSHYERQFYHKTVLCNCDDPYESNFTYYFLRNFNKLQLKKLICTSYSGSKIMSITGNIHFQLSLFDENEIDYQGNGYVLIVTSVPGTIGQEVSDNTIADILSTDGVIRKLKGNGDFRSKECLNYLKECDICCTNPPFSLFSELFSLLIKYQNRDYRYSSQKPNR